MPRTTREWAHRKLAEAENNLQWAQRHMCEVGERYDDMHPEISEPLLQIIGTLEEVSKAIGRIRTSF